MKSLSLSLLSICVLSFILIYSCSTDEEPVAPVVQTPQYSLTVTAGEGGTVSTEGGTYDEGTEVTITASANEGFIFNGWEGNNTPEKSLTISLNSNIVLTANFRLMNTTDIINDPEIFNYDVNKDYKEKKVDFYPFAFFASDLSQNVIDGVNLALKTAAEEWGKYGPVEYWVFGTDKQASLDLINKFCERRETLNQWTMTECLTRETDETADHSMIAYQKVGENAILNNRPSGSAAHNGGQYWGIHKMAHSYPFGFDNVFEGIPPQGDFKTVLHEYFHVVQLSSVYSLEQEEMDEAVKPNETIWMMEGGAEYMANYTLFKLINNGTLSFQESWGSLKDKMSEKMRRGKEIFLEDCPNSLLNEFNHQFCRQPGYDLGSWGVAYLLNKVNNQRVLLETFYPNLKELGFEGAFNLSFGYSTSEFYNEFYEFLKLEIEQQLEIIPDI